MTTDLIQIELREHSDGMWSVLEYREGVCDGPCADVGIGTVHHPDCGYTRCTTEEGEAGAREAVAEHYDAGEYTLTVVPYKAVDDAEALLLPDTVADPRALGGEAYPDHSVADNSDKAHTLQTPQLGFGGRARMLCKDGVWRDPSDSDDPGTPATRKAFAESLGLVWIEGEPPASED